MITRLQRRARRGSGGFTLLEVMLALAILAISLTWLIEASMRAVSAENHAKMVTTATFLARRAMVDYEDEVQEHGLGDEAFASDKSVDFDEEAFKRFQCKLTVDQVDLPNASALQTALGAFMGLGGNSNDPNSQSGQNNPMNGMSGMPGMAGMPGGAMGAMGAGNIFTTLFPMIQDGLKQSIRRATVHCEWKENGEPKFVDLVQYVTDVRKIDQLMQMPNLPGGMGGPGAPGMPGATGTTGSTGSTGFGSNPSSGLSVH